MEDITRETLSVEQHGFTRGRSCVDYVFVLQEILEKRKSRGLETLMAFIDLEKAYYSISRYILWEVVENLQIEKWFLIIIKKIYKNNQAQIKQGKFLSRLFYTTKGLQGCSLSPLLFNLYLETVLKQWKKKLYRNGLTNR